MSVQIIYLVVCLSKDDYICSEIFDTKDKAIEFIIIDYDMGKFNLDELMTFSEAQSYIKKYKEFPPKSIDSEFKYKLEKKYIN